MLPYSRVCDKRELINSSNLQSVSFNVLRRIPAKIYLLKVRKRCEIRSKLTIRTPEHHSCVFIVNFERISHPF